MQKICLTCPTTFEITDSDLTFLDHVSPIFKVRSSSDAPPAKAEPEEVLHKFPIPPPSHCPDCRQQQRLALNNELYLYNGKCDLCNKFTLRDKPPGSVEKVYCRDCWHSDKWDARDYGREFDFSRPFFEQIHELKRMVPSQALSVQGQMVNSEYTTACGSMKNCYLVSHADYCEDCCYGYGFKKTKSSMDGFYNISCELCYDCVDCLNCYGLIASQDCHNCSSSAFLRDCVGVKNSFLCVGLREREYCLENKQLTKEAYEEQMAKIDLKSYSQYQTNKKRLKELESTHIFKSHEGLNWQNCSGNHLYNCKDVEQSFDCQDVEGAKYCYQVVLGSKNIMDILQYGTNLQESYFCSIVGENSYHLLFCHECHISCSDLLYCSYMETSRNCFGCANMHKAQYCILNKQYSQDDYNHLVPKIIEHMARTPIETSKHSPSPAKERGLGGEVRIPEWGNFFPSTFSLYGYNISHAQLYYPLTKEEVLARGLKWEKEQAPPKAEKLIPATRLPDNANDIPDDILNWAIMPEPRNDGVAPPFKGELPALRGEGVSEETQKPFRIIKPELAFYRNMNLPIPRVHPTQRHLNRLAKRNPRKLWTRPCSKCAANMQTTFAPDRPETVYCESCYLQEIYE